MGKICGFPGCSKLSAKAAGRSTRKINGVELCRACYQRLWELEKKTGKTKEQLFREGVSPPKRPLPRFATTCTREGCGVILPERAGPKVRRAIGLIHVCNACYQLAWEHSKTKGISIEEAFRLLKPKNWRPEPPKVARCCLPWCGTDTIASEESLVSDGIYACGKCRSYLKLLGRRPRQLGRDWKDIAKNAVKGNVSAPGTPELCSMSWCGRQEVSHHRGPNGEPICNTDAIYLYYYAKRHGLTFADAFRTAPVPRLLRARKP